MQTTISTSSDSFLPIRVYPQSPRCYIRGIDEQGRVQVAVCKAPEGGKANAEVIKVFKKVFGCPASQICIVKGLTTRNKLLSVTGLNGAAMKRIVTKHIKE